MGVAALRPRAHNSRKSLCRLEVVMESVDLFSSMDTRTLIGLAVFVFYVAMAIAIGFIVTGAAMAIDAYRHWRYEKRLKALRKKHRGAIPCGALPRKPNRLF